MTLFNNPNFLDHILRFHNADQQVTQDQLLYIQTLIELETRELVETAMKFMRRDRRDILSLEDIELATKEIRHGEMAIGQHSKFIVQNEQIVKEDRVFQSAVDVLKQELISIGNRHVEGPRLEGRWIYVKGRIPALNENINLKRLEQLNEIENHERTQKKKVYNIIKDQPYSLMTKQQRDYFMKMCHLISTDHSPSGNITIQGNLNDLMPFFLKFLGEAELNETAISFLLKLIQSRYIWKGIEFYLAKVLCLLLAYKGPKAYEVGVKLAELVTRFSDKYEKLRDIFVGYSDESYSTIIKKIPFQIYTGVELKLDPEILGKCKADSEKNDQMAILCMKALLQNSSQLSLFKSYLTNEFNTFIYWHPSRELKRDPFLGMF